MSEQKSILGRATPTPSPKGSSVAVIAALIVCIGAIMLVSIRILRDAEPDVKVGHYGLVRPEREWDKPGAEHMTVKVLNPVPIMGYAEGDRCTLPDDGSVKVVAECGPCRDALMEYLGPARASAQSFEGDCPIGTLFRVYSRQAEDMRVNLRGYDYRRGREHSLVWAYYLSAH